MRRAIPFLILLGFAVTLVHCTRAPLKSRSEALRPGSAPSVSDDLGRADFVAALEEHAAFLSLKTADSTLRFGKKEIAAVDYARALQWIVALSAKTPDDKEFFEAIEKNFEFHDVYGGDRWGEILLTSYFEPELEGALKPSDRFSEPLLQRPEDLVEVASSKYEERLTDVGSLRGRLWRDPARKRDILIPFYSRAEILNGALKGRGLEVCWVDPIDAFFMHIQGSGSIVLPDETRLRLGYSDQNGHTYHSIGKFLLQAIPLEKMSLYAIESHLRSLSPAEARTIMNKNPSFIFFEKLDSAPKTSLGNSVFPGRTLATDTRYFPKGALAFLKFKKPVFQTPEDKEPSAWEEAKRFVIDQDTGGAIRGGARADLFWGSGAEAKRHAGFVKDPAVLQYLVPKDSVLAGTMEDQLVPSP
jgi:membrane-bound lytic murein transglycosylase A